MLMETVVSATAFPTATDRDNFRKAFIESPEAALMIQDIFWYIFCNEFRDKGQRSPGDKAKNRTDVAKLVNRLAGVYAKLLVSSNDNEAADKFFLKFPDIIAQIVYIAFKQAYPVSNAKFNEDFKMLVADTIAELVTGLKSSNPTFTYTP